ncbi:MAG: hypothetical protein IPN29_19645 [Saprospiraceae bacterium]|nr:hypothetical protein [Saprospiraceae bacterium]
MRKYLLLVIIILVVVHTAKLQPWGKLYGDDANFYSLKAQFEAYWKDKNQEKGKGFKAFKRWEYYWEPRVNADGTFPDGGRTLKEYNDYFAESIRQDLGNRFLPANFSSLGPSTTNGGYAGTGRINSLAFHPGNSNIIFAGTAGGGLWKSTDGGSTWFTQTDQLATLGVSSIAIHPVNNNIIFIATGDADGGDNYSVGILVSLDGGATFLTTGLTWNTSAQDVIKKIIFDPDNPNNMLAISNLGIHRSTDRGVNWALVSTGDFDDLEAHPTASVSTYYACKGGEIYKSTDDGITWSLKQTIASTNRIALAVSPADANLVYALCSKSSNNGFNGLYKSVNSGESYDSQSTSPNILGWSVNGSDTGGQGWYDLVIAADPLNANTIYTGGVNTWKSTDGGISWTINTMWYGVSGIPEVHADKHALDWQNNTTLWQGNDGGVYKTNNGGSTWQHKGSGIVNSQMYKLGVSQMDQMVLTGLQDNGTKLRSNNASWSDVIGGDGMECAIQQNDGTVMYGSLYNGIFNRSVNGGQYWQNISDNIPGAPSGAWVTPFEVDPSLPTTIYAAYQQVYKSTDRGTTWVSIGNFSNNNTLNHLRVAPSDTKYIYAARNNGNLWRTTDGGTTWTQMTSPGNNVGMLIISPNDPNVIWVVRQNFSSGAKVYKSTNGGGNWTNISGTLPNIPANCLVYQLGTSDGLYLGMDVGIYYRDNTLGDWVLFNTGLPNVEVTELEINYDQGKLYAATYGRGLWSSDLYTPVLCTMPKGVKVSNIWNVSFTLEWQAPSSVPSAGYEWGINTSPAVPTTLIATSDTFVNHTGLIPNTAYYLFVRSDCGGGQKSSWVRYGPVFTLPACPSPINITQTGFGPNQATFSWTSISVPAGGYEYALTSVITPPSSGTAQIPSTATITGLTSGTYYYFHVRSNCIADGLSNWTTLAFQTSYTCGNNYYDSGGSGSDYGDGENRIQTICPSNVGEMAVLSISSMGIEEEWDALYIHDGNTTNDPIFSSGNPSTQAGFPAGGYYGFIPPGIFTSTHPSGCLTPQFLSDESVTESGWQAVITCVNVCSTIVSNANDDGPGSLRFAINCNPAGSTIQFNSALETTAINLTSGPLVINKNITLSHGGALPAKISIAGEGPVVNISAGSTVTLQNLVLYSGTKLNGRAIHNAGNLTLNNVTIYDNGAAPANGSTIYNTGVIQMLGTTRLKE